MTLACLIALGCERFRLLVVEGEVLDTDELPALEMPYGFFRHVLVTSERSPIEPQTEHKYYAPGVGEIAERVVKGHHEEFKLVSVR